MPVREVTVRRPGLATLAATDVRTIMTYPPGNPVAQRSTNVLAVVSLVLALVSFCALPVLGAIAAIVTGHLARRQIAATGEEGAGLATAGIVLGWVHLAIALLAAVAAVVLVIVGASILPGVQSSVAPSPFPS
jgi:hypothetical protein